MLPLLAGRLALELETDEKADRALPRTPTPRFGSGVETAESDTPDKGADDRSVERGDTMGMLSSPNCNGGTLENGLVLGDST